MLYKLQCYNWNLEILQCNEIVILWISLSRYNNAFLSRNALQVISKNWNNSPVTPSSHWLLVQYTRVVKIYRYFRDIYIILVNYLHIIWRLGVCFGGRCTYYDDERPRGRFRRRWPVGSQINFGTWASLDASKRVSVDTNNRVSIDTNRVPQGTDLNKFHIPKLSSKQSTLGVLILASLEMRILRDFLMVISTQNVRNVNLFGPCQNLNRHVVMSEIPPLLSWAQIICLMGRFLPLKGPRAIFLAVLTHWLKQNKLHGRLNDGQNDFITKYFSHWLGGSICYLTNI